MTVFVDGIEQYTWPVSTGGPGYATPSGSFTASSMNEVWYSKQWDNAPMPNSIFFTKEGHAIHGSYETKKLGRAVSHGCVRLAPENAKTLYALVEEQGLENTKVVLTGVTPGGEAKVASQARSKNRNRQAGAAGYDPRDYYYPPRPQRRGLFGRRWFGGPYYDGPQGYYKPLPGYYPPGGYRRDPQSKVNSGAPPCLKECRMYGCQGPDGSGIGDHNASAFLRSRLPFAPPKSIECLVRLLLQCGWGAIPPKSHQRQTLCLGLQWCSGSLRLQLGEPTACSETVSASDDESVGALLRTEKTRCRWMQTGSLSAGSSTDRGNQ